MQTGITERQGEVWKSSNAGFPLESELSSLIRRSHVYAELIEEKEGGVLDAIPSEYYFRTIDELLSNRLERTLHVLRYWNINPLPYEVIKYAFGHVDEILELSTYLIYYFDEICTILNSTEETVCTEAVRIGSLNLLKVAHENNCDWDDETCRAAISADHAECMIYAIENGCMVDEWLYWDTRKMGASKCLTYLTKLVAVSTGNPGKK